MGLITKTVMMRWWGTNKEWYVDKGYIFTKMNDFFEVNVEDLSKGTQIMVDVKCDGEDCKDVPSKPIKWGEYKKRIHEDGTFYCNKCSHKIFGTKKMMKTKLKNGENSFECWCKNNNHQDFLDRWDYNLNVDKDGNKLTPNNVNYGSMGINKKGYWFKCLEHPEHKSELKSIGSLTSGRQSTISCLQCKSIKVTNPELVHYFVNEDDAIKYTALSTQYALMKCPDCGFEQSKEISKLINKKFVCTICGNRGMSYPEKLMFALLTQLNLYFKKELTKKIFDWCGDYRYDFYLFATNVIIGTHGNQHYVDSP